MRANETLSDFLSHKYAHSPNLKLVGASSFLLGSHGAKGREQKEISDAGKNGKIKSEGNGQTGEGIGAMAVRLLGCHAFTDAPDTSVVLCSRGGKAGDGGGGGGWDRCRRGRNRKRFSTEMD